MGDIFCCNMRDFPLPVPTLSERPVNLAKSVRAVLAGPFSLVSVSAGPSLAFFGFAISKIATCWTSLRRANAAHARIDK